MNKPLAYRFNPHQDPERSPSLNKLSVQDRQSPRTAPWQSQHVWYPGPNEALLRSSEGEQTGAALSSTQQPGAKSNGASQTQVGQEQRLPFNNPVVVPSRTYVVEERFQILQRWEGVVLKILSDTFTASLVDRTDQQGPDEVAEFFNSDIAEADLHLLEEGAVFYWSIGYRNTLDGQRQRVSELRFRRLPAWSKKEIAATKQDVQHLKAILGKHYPHSTA